MEKNINVTLSEKTFKDTDSNFQIFLQKNEKIIGSIGCILAIIMFSSLIEVLISNLQGHSKIFIQPLATAVNGFFWSLYAYGKKDKFLLLPNILGLILGIVTAMSVLVF